MSGLPIIDGRPHYRGQPMFPREPVVAWLRKLLEQGWTRREIASATRTNERQIYAYLKGKRMVNGQDGRERLGWVSLDVADRIACATGHHLWELEDDAAA